MADLNAIFADPNYVNANAATKQAIVDRFLAQDPNFTGANADTQQAIRTRFKVETPPPPEATSTPVAPSTFNVAISAPYKAVAGAADMVLNTPQNLTNLAKIGFGTAAIAAGRPDLAPNVVAPRQPVAEFLQRQGFIRPTDNMTGGQRLLDAGLQAATGGALGLAASGRELAANVIKGLTAGIAGQTTTEVTNNPVAGLTVAMATPSAITAAAQVNRARAQADQARNAVRDLTLQTAQREGYVVTPGSVTANLKNVLLERLAGKTRTQQEFAEQNQRVTDDLARRAASLPDGAPLTRANMKTISSDEYNKGYVPLNAIGTARTDANFNQALDDVLAAYTGPGRSFPNAIPQPVQDLVANYRVQQFKSVDAVGATRKLRASADANMARGDNDLGLAQRAISNAIEDQLERILLTRNSSLAHSMLETFRASRQRIAISHAIKDAIVEGGGSVNARQLANDLQTRGRYFSGDLELIAKFANTARPVMTSPGVSGTPIGSTMGVGYGVGGGLVGGLLGQNPYTVALGAALPYAASAAARSYLSSSVGQRGAFPVYERPSVNMLATPSSDPRLSALLTGLPVINQNALAP